MEKELNSARPIRGYPMKSGKIVARFAFVSVALLMGVASCPTRPWAQSFDCAEASTPSEQLDGDTRKLAERGIKLADEGSPNATTNACSPPKRRRRTTACAPPIETE